MRTIIAAAIAATVVVACVPFEDEAAPPLVELVDPTIGSGGMGFAYGGAFTGAALPHGLAKAGPDTTGPLGETGFVHTSGSWAPDETILCFSHLHLHGAGLAEGGVVAWMPTNAFDPARRRAVDHQATRVDERARPGTYAVHLAEPDIDVATAATLHGAHHEVAFQDGTAHATIVLDLARVLVGGAVSSAALDVDLDRVVGRVRTEGDLSPPGGYEVFFVLQADAPFTATAWSTERAPGAHAHVEGTGVGAALDFGARDRAQPVTLSIALSLVDADGAARNFAAELGGRTHGDVERAATAEWHALLGRATLFGGDDAQRTIFASALYRSFLMPTVQSDVDGRWLGPDGAVRTAEGFRMMTDMSLWDTYRTVHPLYALAAPQSARDAALSLVAFVEAGGFLPTWPMATGDASVMVGASGEVVLADALARGVVDADDLAPAWATLRAAALDTAEPAAGRGGRGNVVAYDRLGYVPFPLRGGVSTTLEYALDDTSLARIAAALGHDDDAARLRDRARGWRALFDPATGFLRGRDEAGAFVIADDAFFPEDFNQDYVEADAWQSSFPYDDVPGFVLLHGGRAQAADKIRALFDATKAHWDGLDRDGELFGVQPLPFHWQGNEPSIHVPALAYELGDNALGASFVRWVMTTQYGAGADGLPGNDDGGALSSWWVLAAMGLHAIPGGPDWVWGAPLFPKVQLGALTVRVVGPLNGVPVAATLDGRRIPDARIDGRALAAAHELVVTTK